MNLKKRMLLNIPYGVIGLLAAKLSEGWRLAVGANASEKALNLMSGICAAFQSPLPSFHPADLCFGLLTGVLLRIAVHIKSQNARKYRKGMEYGSARWGNAEDIKPYIDPTFENNVILTQSERLMMSNRPKNPAHARNKNVLVIGGSGSGKTRFWLKPNLMQCHSSYIVTDPKGDIVVDCGRLLLKKGYRLKILNTINFQKSIPTTNIPPTPPPNMPSILANTFPPA